MYVCLSDIKPASWFKKSIKKVMKDRSKKMCAHGVSVNQRSDVCLLHIVCDFLFYGYPCSKKEYMALQCPEIYGIRPTNEDILVNVSCKFEMYIFKIAQVINELNVRIAFLYVLSIYRLYGVY